MKKFLLAMLLVAGSVLPISQAQAGELPKVVSFDFSPKEIELTSPETTVTFELVVSHPNGIENTSTIITATGPRNSTIAGYLNRVNQIGISDSKPVTFKGSITFSRTVAEGAYSIKVNGVSNVNSTSYQYSTGDITPAKFRNIVGAESALLVRLMGEANIAYNMFSGPTYDTLNSPDFKDIKKYNRQATPILRVGETYNPNDYFESYVPGVPLRISTSTPAICTTDGTLMKFISTGNCQFKVITNKTKEYVAQSSDQNVTIGNARPKSSFYVSEIASQLAKDLPKTLALPQVYSAAAGYVLPTSITPSVCIASAFTVRLISGGTCTLTYQTPETDDYLASDIYKQNIEIVRDPQTISFAMPKTISLTQKNLQLKADASSGGPIVFSTKDSKVCSVGGSILQLNGSGDCEVTATQAGTSLLAAASLSQTVKITSQVRKSITCVKDGKKIKNSKKKCPRGYKQTRR